MSWNTKAISRDTPVCSTPSKTTVPLDASVSPSMIRRSVVLPQPEGPTRLMNSPSSIARSTLFSATTSLDPVR